MTKDKKSMKRVDNKSGLAAEAGLLEARVLPKHSWLQRESLGLLANARHSGCQSATALGMGCGEIIACAKNPETRAIYGAEIRATNFSWRYSAVEKWKYSCGDTATKTV